MNRIGPEFRWSFRPNFGYRRGFDPHFILEEREIIRYSVVVEKMILLEKRSRLLQEVVDGVEGLYYDEKLKEIYTIYDEDAAAIDIATYDEQLKV